MSGYRIGWDQVKSGYDLFKNKPYYALFEGGGRGKAGRLVYGYTGEDLPGEGWEMLKQCLEVADVNTPTSEYIVQFYDNLGKGDTIRQDTPYSGSFALRMRPQENRALAGIGNTGMADQSFLNYLQQELHQQKEKVIEQDEIIKDLEAQLDEYEKQPQEKIDGVIGQIGAIGNSFPWLADLIKDWSTVMKHKYTHRPQHAAGIAGVPQAAAGAAQPVTGNYAEKINDAQKKLMTWYAKTYGDLQTTEGRISGAERFADDLLLMAKLTEDEDDDMMLLLLKKLRATA